MMIFNELLEKNILWTDPKIDNVGRLLKDNVIDYGGLDYISPNMTGFVANKLDYLKAGDYVVLDLDHLYDLNKSNNNYFVGPLFHKYKKPYILKKRQTKV